MSKIFLCHASEDKKFVETLAKDLIKFGLEVWFDKYEMKVGESLLDKIDEGITGSGYFAVVLSPHSVNKPWVKHEIQSAFAKKFLDSDFKILPILYEECTLPLYLASLLYADFTANYENGLKQILNVFGLNYLEICTKENWRAVHRYKRKNGIWKQYKDDEYRELLTSILGFCYQNHWGIYVGGHSNPYAIAFSAQYQIKKGSYHFEFINLRLCADDVYRLAVKQEHNPNNLKAGDYTIELGNNMERIREKLMDMMSEVNKKYGMPRQRSYMYCLSRIRTEEEKQKLIDYVMNDTYIFNGNFLNTIKKMQENDSESKKIKDIYM